MCSTDNNSSMNNGMQRDDVGDAFGSFGRSSTVSPLSVAQLAPTQRYAIYYNMNHSKRGVALIFNHEFFTVPHLKPRCGTNVDCENLTLALKNLGFEVNDFHNLTHKDVVKQLERAAEMDHSEHDCLVIAVLSHGELGLLYAHDTAYKADSLWHYFTADKCQSLAGKPKLFFIQACQGDKLDPGINLKERTETDGLVSTFRIPTQADFLIAYSTIPGHTSQPKSCTPAGRTRPRTGCIFYIQIILYTKNFFLHL
ncbi:caspase-1 isoform X2 [Temnothorax nylanderi]|uniref:caspase-1 isoform X2 n=1 Tax=Temnothorax nylanderi TaxID=102681 RepID=UPI003A8C36C7